MGLPGANQTAKTNQGIKGVLAFADRLLRSQVKKSPLVGRAVQPYAMLTGGYSVIWRSEADAASGPVVGGVLGLRVKVAGMHAIFSELSYQKGFQTLDSGAYGPSYLIIGAGWQVGI